MNKLKNTESAQLWIIYYYFILSLKEASHPAIQPPRLYFFTRFLPSCDIFLSDKCLKFIIFKGRKCERGQYIRLMKAERCNF